MSENQSDKREITAHINFVGISHFYCTPLFTSARLTQIEKNHKPVWILKKWSYKLTIEKALVLEKKNLNETDYHRENSSRTTSEGILWL